MEDCRFRLCHFLWSSLLQQWDDFDFDLFLSDANATARRVRHHAQNILNLNGSCELTCMRRSTVLFPTSNWRNARQFLSARLSILQVSANYQEELFLNILIQNSTSTKRQTSRLVSRRAIFWMKHYSKMKLKLISNILLYRWIALFKRKWKIRIPTRQYSVATIKYRFRPDDTIGIYGCRKDG